MLCKSPLNPVWHFIVAFEKCQGKKTLYRHKYVVKVGGGESKPHKAVSFLFLFMYPVVSQCIHISILLRESIFLLYCAVLN